MDFIFKSMNKHLKSMKCASKVNNVVTIQRENVWIILLASLYLTREKDITRGMHYTYTYTYIIYSYYIVECNNILMSTCTCNGVKRNTHIDPPT